MMASAKLPLSKIKNNKSNTANSLVSRLSKLKIFTFLAKYDIIELRREVIFIDIKIIGNFFEKNKKAANKIREIFSSKKEEKKQESKRDFGHAYVDGTLIIYADGKYFRLEKVGNKVTCIQMTPIKIHREAK